MDKYKFLVVDDSSTELKDTLAIIKKSGHEAVGVLCLSDALIQMKEYRFHFILTDIHLSDQSDDKPLGLQLLQDVKALHPSVIPLAMSKDPDVAIFDRAIAYGALQFLKKPLKNWD